MQCCPKRIQGVTMAELKASILSNILEKRLRELGFETLRKFYMAHRESIGVSYELLRQVMHDGRIPRIESILPILQAAQIPPPAVRTLISRLYPNLQGGPLRDPAGVQKKIAAGEDDSIDVLPASVAAPPEGSNDWGPGCRSPEELARRLSAALSRIPIRGNGDLWDMAYRLSEIAEKKVRDRSRGRIDQPFLFGKEPEAIYQFLVRRGKAVPFMSKGEDCPLEFRKGIDYADRFRGVLLGQAIGASMGRISQGLSGGDVAMLYGRVESPMNFRSGGSQPTAACPINGLLASRLSENPALDPEAIASVMAIEISCQDATGGENLFSSNFRERDFPWFEAGEPIAESAAAVRCIPFALLHAGDFRRLKLESGICATITHPNPSAIAGATLLSVLIARLLHTLPDALDPISLARSCGPLIAGIETDRSGGRNRTAPSMARKIGTELPALLLRRASVEDILKTIGNGETPSEGIPFAIACVLSNPGDFGGAIVSAVNSGNDAIRICAMVGAMAGAFLGASAIPVSWVEGLDGRKELEEAADSLLGYANPRQPESNNHGFPAG